PSRPPYGGINAEEGIALADEALREELKRTYPEMWARVEQRRKYMMEELGIQLKPEVLPLSNLAAYVRPLLLDQERALKVVRD
ncbi:MAG: Xaa-Pro aminopeptidase, partial [Christensenellales bacterium]